MSAEPPHSESTFVAQSPRKGGPLSGGAGVLLVIVLLGGAGALFYKNYRHAEAEAPVETQRRFMCSGDSNVFMYALKKGESPPVPCTVCKKSTGFPCEACYWTRDGQTKDTPTFVILNHHLGKSGDTICPDCGRVVVGHNPDPRSVTVRDAVKNADSPTPAASDAAATQPAGETPSRDERDR